MLLLEGGLAGHMKSPFESRELTFSKLKKILSLAANGKLIGTEKVDGYQLYLSFRDGKAYGVRNKNDIKNGGLNIDLMIKREFKGGESVKKVYIQALESFEKTCNNLNPKIQQQLFDDGGTIWYNTELMGPSIHNVINYDNNVIVIHSAGTLKYNPETKEIEPYNDPQHAKFLDKAVDQIEQQTTNVPFSVRKDAVIKLKKINNENDLKIAINRINKILSNSNLSDSNTIEDLLRVNINKLVESKLPELSKEIKENIVENILGNEKLSLPSGSPRELRGRISQIKKQGELLLKKAIFPLEETISDFSVAMLEGLESAFILDNKKEVQNLRKQVTQAIKSIQASGNVEAMEILNKQLQKLKNVENINTTAEGFVFSYEGQTYKFTGSFAPINQILGIFRYGRGKIPAMQQSLDEDEENDKSVNRIAAIPGGFKPPHKGHYGVIKYFADMPNIDKVFIFISPKERAAHSVDRRIVITAEMSKKIWEVYTRGNPKIEIRIAEKSPVKTVYDFMEELNPGDILYLGQGEKEEAIGDSRFKNAQQWSDKNNLGIKVKPISTPTFAEGLSGTMIRDLIAEGEKEKFLSLLPEHLSIKEKNLVWQIVNTQPMGESKVPVFEDYQSQVKKDYSQRKERVIGKGGQSNTPPYSKKPSMKRAKSAPPGFGGLEETSSMSAGDVEGAFTKSPWKNIEDIKRDEKKEDKYMKSRKDFIEELNLRECISKMIKESYENIIFEKKLEILEENKLRKEIRNLLMEVKQDEDIPESSTGINVLRDLLKKIIPILETDYKSLTTSKEQRISFRSHIIRAVKTSLVLGEKDITGTVKDKDEEETEQLEEQDDEKLNINVGKDANINSSSEDPIRGGKFIDITQKSKPKDDMFTIQGEDATGRNMASRSYEKIEKNIIDAFHLLGDEEDQSLFTDYLQTNLKLYFDKFEQELSATISEPTNKTYEDEKAKQSSEEKAGEEAALTTEPIEEPVEEETPIQ